MSELHNFAICVPFRSFYQEESFGRKNIEIRSFYEKLWLKTKMTFFILNFNKTKYLEKVTNFNLLVSKI